MQKVSQNPLTKKIRKGLIVLSFSISLAAAYFIFTNFNKNTDQTKQNTGTTTISDTHIANSKVQSFNLPDSVFFADELVPTHYFDVYESVERELHAVIYFQSMTLTNLKRANRYFPIIEPILEKNGIPDDFKYLAITESNLDNLVSSAGAAGVWQFLESTAKQYKMEINDEIDERYNLYKATEATCKYLKSSYNKFSNWPLVAASFNYGEGNIQKQIKRQKVKNYYNMIWNIETGRYLYRIIAVKLVHENPSKYGFNIDKNQLYPPIPLRKVIVDSTILNLADFAIAQGSNFKMLKYFNPWLRDDKLTNLNHKVYEIELPSEDARLYKNLYNKSE